LLLLALLAPSLASALELTQLHGELAPSLRLPDLNGQAYDLADLRGRVVLVNIWASWCQPCLAEMLVLRELAERFANRPFTLLAVSSGERLSLVKRAVQRYGIGLQVLVDPGGEQTGAWGITGLPTSYLVDAEGRVRTRFRGPMIDGGWEAADAIEALLAEVPGGKPDRRAKEANGEPVAASPEP
jgi:cytochrome c biogenesis protein CcmG/thiol:disulfide interchange protein DsbE